MLPGVALNAKELQATSPTASSESSIQINLTPEEIAWLVEHKSIRLGVALRGLRSCPMQSRMLLKEAIPLAFPRGIKIPSYRVN